MSARDPAAVAVPDRDEARMVLGRLWTAEADQPRDARLRAHAHALRRLLRERRDMTDLLAGRLAADAPDAHVLAVRRLTLGWAVDEGAGPDDAEAIEFDAALDGLIRGFVTLPPAQPRLLYMRLWTLLSVAREAADVTYSRAGQLPELDRRILLILFRSGAHVLKDLTALTGVDKAQVSRAVKRLGEGGLIVRTTIRQPMALTAEGRALTARLRRLYATRSRALVQGLDANDLDGFYAGLDEVSARAVALFEAERMRDTSGERPPPGDLPTDLMTEQAARTPEIIFSRLIALLSYIQRSASFNYKRLLGLSNFEAWVLVEIARDPPIEWATLSNQIGRDDSQAARTIRRLVELELVEHHGQPGRRQGLLDPTPDGARAAATIDAEQWRRNALLMDGIAPETVRAFLGGLDRMTWNVQAQLVRDLAQRAGDAGR